jgi:predicted MFS family arabinose efflux permease
VQLAAARVAVGVGEAACSPPAHSLLADYFPPRRRASALSIYAMGIHVGILVGLVVGGWVNDHYGWRAAFYVVGLPGLLLALLVRLTVREPRRGASEGAAEDETLPSTREVFDFLWRLRSFRHLSIASALTAFAGYGVANWGPAFLMRVHEVSAAEVGMKLGVLLGSAGAAGSLLAGFVVDVLSRRDARWALRVPAVAALVSLPFALLFLFWPELDAALVFAFPAFLVGAMWQGPIFAVTQSLARLRMRSVASAILLFIINLIGLGLGPWAVGILNDTVFRAQGDEAVRFSLASVIVVMNLWAMVHFALAARTLREDLRARELPA